VERKDVGGRAENHAILTFAPAPPRPGFLAGRSGAHARAGLCSPDATLAVAGAGQESAKMLEDVSGLTNANLWAELAGFEAGAGVNVRTDLIEPLGGEVAFAPRRSDPAAAFLEGGARGQRFRAIRADAG